MNGPGAYLRALDLLTEAQEDGGFLGARADAKVRAATAYATLAQAAACTVNDPAWAEIAALPVSPLVTEETERDRYASLPVGQIVRVKPFASREEEPFYGKVVGYDMPRSKYQIRCRYGSGFGEGDFWPHHSYYFPSEVEEFDPSLPQRIEVTLSVDVPRSFALLGEDEIAEMACAELETSIGTQDGPLEDGDLLRVRVVSWRRL